MEVFVDGEYMTVCDSPEFAVVGLPSSASEPSIECSSNNHDNQEICLGSEIEPIVISSTNSTINIDNVTAAIQGTGLKVERVSDSKEKVDCVGFFEIVNGSGNGGSDVYLHVKNNPGLKCDEIGQKLEIKFYDKDGNIVHTFTNYGCGDNANLYDIGPLKKDELYYIEADVTKDKTCGSSFTLDLGSSGGLIQSNDKVIISGKPINAGVYSFDVETLPVGCVTQSTKLDVEITVKDTAKIQSSGNLNQELCVGGDMSVVTFTSNTELSANDLPSGVNLSLKSQSEGVYVYELTGNPSGSGVVDYVVSTQNLNGCGVKNVRGSFTFTSPSCSNSSLPATIDDCEGNVTIPLPEVTANCTISKYVYKLGDADYKETTSNVTVPLSEGAHTVLWKAYDAAGNASPVCTTTVNVTRTKTEPANPTASIHYCPSDGVISVNASAGFDSYLVEIVGASTPRLEAGSSNVFSVINPTGTTPTNINVYGVKCGNEEKFASTYSVYEVLADFDFADKVGAVNTVTLTDKSKATVVGDDIRTRRWFIFPTGQAGKPAVADTLLATSFGDDAAVVDKAIDPCGQWVAIVAENTGCCKAFNVKFVVPTPSCNSAAGFEAEQTLNTAADAVVCKASGATAYTFKACGVSVKLNGASIDAASIPTTMLADGDVLAWTLSNGKGSDVKTTVCKSVIRIADKTNPICPTIAEPIQLDACSKTADEIKGIITNYIHGLTSPKLDNCTDNANLIVSVTNAATQNAKSTKTYSFKLTDASSNTSVGCEVSIALNYPTVECPAMDAVKTLALCNPTKAQVLAELNKQALKVNACSASYAGYVASGLNAENYATQKSEDASATQYTIVWKFKDADGNELIPAGCPQKFKVVIPDFEHPTPLSGDVNCVEKAVKPSSVPTVNDALNNPITPEYKGSTKVPADFTCDGKVVHTYTYKDCAGHSFDWTYTYRVTTTGPVINAEGVPNSSDITCIDAAVQPTHIPTATNGCGHVITPSAPVRTENWTGKEKCVGTIKYTYTYTDCGNSQDWTYTYNLTSAKPVLSTEVVGRDLLCNPTSIPEVKPSDFTVTNACGTNQVEVNSADSHTDCSYQRVYTASYTNGCETAEPLVVTYTWKEDKVIPVLRVTKTEPETCNPSIVAPVFVASDNCEGEISSANINVTTDGVIGSGCSKQQTWKANYTDGCGNKAEELSVTYEWTEDKTAPTVSAKVSKVAAVKAGTCKYSVPDLCSDTYINFSDECSSSPTYVQSPAAGELISENTEVTIAVKDGCNNTSTVQITVEVPVALTASIVLPDAGCPNNTYTISSKVEGGTAPYTYTWSGNVSGSGASVTLNTDKACKDYGLTLHVKDANGCEANATGKTFTPVDGEKPTATGTAKTTLDLCISDALPTAVTGIDALEALSGLTFSDNCTAHADLSVSSSDKTITSSDCKKVVERTYNVSDKCGNSYEYVQTITMEDKSVPTISINAGKSSVKANVDKCVYTVPDVTGFVTVSDACKKGTLNVIQSPAAGANITETTSVTVTVSDGCEHSADATIEVTVPNAISVKVSDIVAAKCNGDANGSFKAVATGGTPEYTYAWNGKSNSDGVFSGLGAGKHTLTVSDSKGCSTSQEVEIEQPEKLTASIVLPEAGCPNIAYTIGSTVNGGNVGYTYTWSVNGNGGSESTYVIAATSGCANYTINLRVVDAKGCVANAVEQTFSTVDTEAPKLLADKEWPSDITGKNACKSAATGFAGELYNVERVKDLYGDNCGSVNVSLKGEYALTGTDCAWTLTRTYVISDNCGNSIEKTMSISGGDNTVPAISVKSGSESVAATALAECKYSVPDVTGLVTVSDNCSALSDLKITQSPAANTVISGSQDITVTVTDLCGNEKSATIRVTVPNAISVDVSDIVAAKCNGDANGSFKAVATGGTPEYTYAWNGKSNSDGVFSGLGAGKHTLTVSDSKGCSTSQEVEIEQPEKLTASIVLPEAGCPNIAYTIGSTVNGGNVGYTYTWSVNGNGGSESTYVIAATSGCANYTINLRVVDAKGCVANAVEQTFSTVDTEAPKLLADKEWPSDITGKNACKSAATGFAGELYNVERVKDLYGDNCGSVNVSLKGEYALTGTDCAWTLTRTYVISDNCGNSIEKTMSISGGDNTVPAISVKSGSESVAATALAECKYSVPDVTGLVTVSDNCSALSDLKITQSPAANTVISGSQDITVTVTDLCGNEKSATIRVTVPNAISVDVSDIVAAKCNGDANG
ncbi:MAG: SprB repeat-containing protein, partial [Paludibacteraceae bacterium]|nr:SprB repeat-containing protein [Paludibacteraceae bacterium]